MEQDELRASQSWAREEIRLNQGFPAQEILRLQILFLSEEIRVAMQIVAEKEKGLDLTPGEQCPDPLLDPE